MVWQGKEQPHGFQAPFLVTTMHCRMLSAASHQALSFSKVQKDKPKGVSFSSAAQSTSDLDVMTHQPLHKVTSAIAHTCYRDTHLKITKQLYKDLDKNLLG